MASVCIWWLHFWSTSEDLEPEELLECGPWCNGQLVCMDMKVDEAAVSASRPSMVDTTRETDITASRNDLKCVSKVVVLVGISAALFYTTAY